MSVVLEKETRAVTPKPSWRRSRSRTIVVERGEPFVWLSGGALALCLAMVFGLILWIAAKGLGTFWPHELVRLELKDGSVALGEVHREETFVTPEGDTISRRLVRIENYELTGEHYRWIREDEVSSESSPNDALTIERRAGGRLYGIPQRMIEVFHLWKHKAAIDRGLAPNECYEIGIKELEEIRSSLGSTPQEFLVEQWEGDNMRLILVDPADVNPGDLPVAVCVKRREPGELLDSIGHALERAQDAWEKKRSQDKEAAGDVNAALEEARIQYKQAQLDHSPPEVWIAVHQEWRHVSQGDDPEYTKILQDRLNKFEDEFGSPTQAFLDEVKDVEEKEAEARRVYAEIRKGIDELERELAKDALVIDTTSGPVVLPMSNVVRFFAANHLDVWAKAEVYSSRIFEFLTDDPREANNEGGVFPAIFGTVLMTLLMTLAVVPFGVLAALYMREYAKTGPLISTIRIAVNNLAGVPSIVFGVFGLGFFCYIVGGTIDDTFFEAHKPSPTFATGGLIWASLTLALMTLPVVIVATEEALAAVPASMREGSYACGATRWQTIRRIVLPRAMPGIMTGAILAMARGAGEVAPLMLVGAVKLAPELPFSFDFPFGINRSFMHLGFHIYDLGFQSQNSEAAKPMVYTTTLLLVTIIATLNLGAIALRTRLRRRFTGNQF